MKRRPRKTGAIIACAVMMASSCSREASLGESEYRLLYAQELTTLNYMTTSAAGDLKIMANCIDGLLDYDRWGNPVACLAVTWETNEDSSVWTFHLRDDAWWCDRDTKRIAPVTAYDFTASARYINDAQNNSAVRGMFTFILGADEYYSQSVHRMLARNAVRDGVCAAEEDYYARNGVDPSLFMPFEDVGVTALDEHTLRYAMAAPCPFFESVAASSAFLPVYEPFLEAAGLGFGSDNSSVLYNGAYVLASFEAQYRRTLLKNPDYWDAARVFIPRVEYRYNTDEATIGPAMLENGEVDAAVIGSDILDAWMSSPARRDLIRPAQPDVSFSYFYSFNFEPRFEAGYDPDNWLIAVNNENFRLSLSKGLDTVKALGVQNPFNPQDYANPTITPSSFIYSDGTDYTDAKSLSQVRSSGSFSPVQALYYRDLALGELSASGAVFPVKIMMPYNTSVLNWDKETLIVEWQLETLLGADYIDVIPVPYAASGFLTKTRRAGNYALMKCNWGADYGDPMAFAEPFAEGGSFGFFYTSRTALLKQKPLDSKSPATAALASEYYRLTAAAKGEKDTASRHEAFAAAEALLISHAFVIPYSVGSKSISGGGYVADRLDPFSVAFAPFGIAQYRFKGAVLLVKPMNAQRFYAAKSVWEEERAKKSR